MEVEVEEEVEVEGQNLDMDPEEEWHDSELEDLIGDGSQDSDAVASENSVDSDVREDEGDDGVVADDGKVADAGVADDDAGPCPKNGRMYLLEGRTFYTLHPKKSEEPRGVSLWCRYHRAEGWHRDCSLGARDPMSVEECCRRLLAWESCGSAVGSTRDDHRLIGQSSLLVDFRTEGF